MRSLFCACPLKQPRCRDPDVAWFLLVDDKTEEGLVQGMPAQEVAMQGRLHDPEAFSAHFEAAIDETSSENRLSLLSLLGTVIDHRPASAQVFLITGKIGSLLETFVDRLEVAAADTEPEYVPTPLIRRTSSYRTHSLTPRVRCA